MNNSQLNRWRADQAIRALEAFTQRQYADFEEPEDLKLVIGDLLGDLMHLAHLELHLPNDRSFERILDRARANYAEELEQARAQGRRDDRPAYRFGRLVQVEDPTFDESTALMIGSDIGYENDSTESANALVLDSFVHGHLVLRAATLGSGRQLYHDPAFFESLRELQEKAG